jgi:hypothetical protein
MKEASPAKYYLARYLFIAIASLQAGAAMLIFFRWPSSPKHSAVVFLFASLALFFFSLHVLIGTRIRRVAVGKKKLAVIESNRVKRYAWDEIRDLQFIRFVNLYSMNIKGRRQKIYFLPTRNSATIYSMFTRAEDLMPKRK